MACGWEPSYSGCTGSEAFLESLTAETRETAETVATDLLDQWTGGLYGACPVTVRPCREGLGYSGMGLDFKKAATGRGPSPWEPVLVGGRWYNIGCGGCGGRCACVDGSRALSLPWPVSAVSRVVIDGEVLDPSAYKVQEQRLLVRTDGGVWPLGQDLLAADDAPGAFAVTYDHGLPVPTGGRVAAGVLAMEFAKALCNDNTCQLPKRVQTVTRQGVTVAMLDGFEDLNAGRVGIWLVDSWVASVTQPRKASRVYSPDIPRRGSLL